jgi:hypothetical protein
VTLYATIEQATMGSIPSKKVTGVPFPISAKAILLLCLLGTCAATGAVRSGLEGPARGGRFDDPLAPRSSHALITPIDSPPGQDLPAIVEMGTEFGDDDDDETDDSPDLSHARSGEGGGLIGLPCHRPRNLGASDLGGVAWSRPAYLLCHRLTC